MKAKYKRNVFLGDDGKYYVNVKAKNGQIVATMQQGYERKSAAIKEFDKIFSVKELDLVRGDLEGLEESLRDERTRISIRFAIAGLEGIQALIDRSEA